MLPQIKIQTSFRHSLNHLNGRMALVSASLSDRGDVVGSLSGTWFDCLSIRGVAFFELADCRGIDFDMLVAAQGCGLLNHRLLVLEAMSIESAYRGKLWGIKMIKRAIREVYKNSLGELTVLMHPCPPHWPDKEYHEEAVKALSNYYAKHLPIKKINQTPYYYLSLDILNPL